MNLEAFLTAAIISLLLSTILIILTFWGFQTRIDIEKTSVYECGFMPYAEARSTFDIKFYLVSLLFLVFDVETLFLFPFAINSEDLSQRELNWIIFFIIFIFLGIYYEIKSKILEF
jgi:NADH-quinone oxidoreductase subunit A